MLAFLSTILLSTKLPVACTFFKIIIFEVVLSASLADCLAWSKYFWLDLLLKCYLNFFRYSWKWGNHKSKLFKTEETNFGVSSLIQQPDPLTYTKVSLPPKKKLERKEVKRPKHYNPRFWIITTWLFCFV